MPQAKNTLQNIETYTIPRYNSDFDLKLDANENPLGCSPKVLKAIKDMDPLLLTRYPSYGELEERIADFNQIPVNQIIVTSGGDEGIRAVFNTFVSENDEVIFATPTYVMYKIDAERLGAKIIAVPYQKKWEYPTAEVLSKISKKTKLIVICSPNNPTGDLVPKEDIIKIIENSKDAIVLLDEAYYRFCNREEQSLKSLVNKYNNLVIMHTFSKDYGLAGLRLGYLISTPNNLDNIRKSTEPFNVNNAAITAAIAALDDQTFVSNYLNILKESKQYTFSKLKSFSNEIYDTHANFVCFYVGEKQEWYHSKLLSRKIKIRRYPTNPSLYGYMRLTLGSKDQMDKVLSCLDDYDAIIFDIDGVIINESQSYRKAIQKTYSYFSGKSVDLDTIQKYKNQGGFNNDWTLTKHLLDSENVEIEMNEVISKFQEFYFKDGKGLINDEEILVNPSYIKELAKQYKLCVFTGRPRAEAEYILGKFQLLDQFTDLITMDETYPDNGKPSPYGLNKLIDKLKTKNILYIGDMPDDIISAQKACVDSVGILPPQDKSSVLKEKLLSLGAIEVYDNLEEAIIKIFDLKLPEESYYACK